MSFSSIAKNEICRIVEEKACCHLAEFSAILRMSGTIQIFGKQNIGFRIITENPAIARRVFTLLKTLFIIKTKQIYCFTLIAGKIKVKHVFFYLCFVQNITFDF